MLKTNKHYVNPSRKFLIDLILSGFPRTVFMKASKVCPLEDKDQRLPAKVIRSRQFPLDSHGRSLSIFISFSVISIRLFIRITATPTYFNSSPSFSSPVRIRHFWSNVFILTSLRISLLFRQNPSFSSSFFLFDWMLQPMFFFF